ncbi:hypothetical protein PV11_00695 [Exophiala sideris]|uniref:Bacteriophage T5 Orf172 DNA-binding domain-containing protein n=1 Tax=Exophiala sideris TaxID=1016849 RepID=A0A0D1W887_9EURO|nr:hypothetical protein PV11_00695 [Exophiala sideris]
MSFSGRTPESLLPRSDSKNPATTCRGITSTGRPCRRALAVSPKSSPAPSPSRGAGVLAVLDEQHAAAFYCWQHKDQAEQLAAKDHHKTSLHPLKERSSIDTLIERVGVLDLDENIPESKRHRRRHQNDDHGHTRRETLPAGWNDMQSPLMSVPEGVSHPRTRQRRPSPRPRSNVKFSWACCIQTDNDDMPPPRVHRHQRKEPDRTHSSDGVQFPSPRYAGVDHLARPEMRQKHDRSPVRISEPASMTERPSPAPSSSNSQTQTLLSFIPPHLSPQTASLLLSELSKPLSPADEAGYIYIFWLTPESEISKPDDETASSLLDDDDLYVPRSQRTSQALQRYSSVRRPQHRGLAQEQRTITLKIGRAANVHRRMSQWTKQCGQNITLIRYYPYTKTADSTGSKASPARKVPHVHRVERLVHLELAEKRVVKSECAECGREHREWFEIEASRAGLRSVDEAVRRWVTWADRQ